jgi:hypothetical protein
MNDEHGLPWQHTNDRSTALDPAEVAIRNRHTWPVMGPRRDQVIARRADAERELTRVDAAIAELVADRRALLERIVGCNLALVGTNAIRDRESGELLQRLPWRRRIPLVDPMPFVGCGDDDRVSGEALRESTVALLRAVAEPMTSPSSNGCSSQRCAARRTAVEGDLGCASASPCAAGWSNGERGTYRAA